MTGRDDGEEGDLSLPRLSLLSIETWDVLADAFSWACLCCSTSKMRRRMAGPSVQVEKVDLGVSARLDVSMRWMVAEIVAETVKVMVMDDVACGACPDVGEGTRPHLVSNATWPWRARLCARAYAIGVEIVQTLSQCPY